MLIDDFHPSVLLQVSYPTSHRSVDLGNTLEPSNAKSAPLIEIHQSSTDPSTTSPKDTTYTIALTDPDAPSRENPEWSEFCHWITTNIPPASSPNGHETKQAANIDAGRIQAEIQTTAKRLKDIVEYKGPAPPKGTGKHRAKGGSNNNNLTTPSERKRWGLGKARHGVRQWAEENKLEPVGANFFYAQNDKQ
ncbi:hypothetical protein FGG08_000828 [Glutinoglossum americanum]|uniref:Uncharacterized protein n=1 Tax=Glutinoglossum americanum TaxID=1670608 RepID=A0A9P8I9F9_9PEZI|nr:hypothetical protein FGG08_000828 [Glutinoglossum americanum]